MQTPSFFKTPSPQRERSSVGGGLANLPSELAEQLLAEVLHTVAGVLGPVERVLFNMLRQSVKFAAGAGGDRAGMSECARAVAALSQQVAQLAAGQTIAQRVALPPAAVKPPPPVGDNGVSCTTPSGLGSNFSRGGS